MNWLSINKFSGVLLNTVSTLSSRSTSLKLVLPLTLICLSACHDKEALQQALIEKTIKEKVSSFQKKKKATCKKEALAEALIIADSMMIKMALSKVDTSGQGNRPVKPARPELNLLVDTTPIKPLFEDTIVQLEDTTNLLEKPELIREDTSSTLEDTISLLEKPKLIREDTLD